MIFYTGYLLAPSWIDAIITPCYFIVIFTVAVFTALKISEWSAGFNKIVARNWQLFDGNIPDPRLHIVCT